MRSPKAIMRAVLAYQRRHKAKGLCICCNEPLESSQLCHRHRLMRNARRRIRKEERKPDPIWLEMGLTKEEYLQHAE